MTSETIEELVRDHLIESYENVLAVDQDPKILKALKRVIKYYSTSDFYNKWKTENEPC